MHLKASVIVTTYNWPSALDAVLSALACQTNLNFEIIVADDGSAENTQLLIERWKGKTVIPLKHVWQEDCGFRAAKIRNMATLQCDNPYLIFMDGDCVPPKTFIENHLKLAEKKFFVSGNRILLNQVFTESVFAQQLPLQDINFYTWMKLRWQKSCNRILPLLQLPLPNNVRKLQKNKWKGVKTCNLAIWRQDFISVNGFDETFEGWGFEDSDLVVRLLNLGIRHKSGRFGVPVFHLWHKENSKDHAEKNLSLLKARIDSDVSQAVYGINQYLI